MTGLCKELYKYLQEEISACSRMRQTKEKEIECCYSIAEGYWRRLSEKLAGHQFKTKEDEISFFKECKPNFTAEIEYYHLLNYAVLFVPPDPVKALEFWKREAVKLDKFIDDNREFYNYYLLGKTDKDEQYFLRINYDEMPGDAKRYETDWRVSANGDRLIATMKALERYQVYALQQVKQLEDD